MQAAFGRFHPFGGDFCLLAPTEREKLRLEYSAVLSEVFAKGHPEFTPRMQRSFF